MGFYAIAALAAFLASGAGAAGLRVTLRPEVRVAPDTAVLLGTVATLDGPRAASAASIELATAPAPGHRALVDRHDVLAGLARNGVGEDEVTLAGADRVRLVASGQPLDAERVRRAVIEAVEGSSGERTVRVRQVIVPGGALVPDGPYEIEVLEPENGLGPGVVRLPLVVRPAGGPEQRVSLTAKIEASGPVLIALRDVPRGQPLSASDVRVEVRPLTAAARWLDDPATLAGTIARGTLRAGQPVPASSVGHGAAVEPGQSIVAFVRAGRITLSLRTTARGRGEVGAIVPVSGVDGHRLVRGRVIAPGRVVVLGSEEIAAEEFP